jgi:ABC-type glutathione transport system ATPase component
MRADIIHVMDDGKIVETGNHQELIAQGGKYAQAWKTQMETASNGSETGELNDSLFVQAPELQEVQG